MLNKVKTFFLELKHLYFNRNMLIIAILGYGSGIPFTLIFGTYTFKLAEDGINLRDIGLFGLAGLPFTIKFIWSPLVDGLKIPFLKHFGQRRSWLLLSTAVLSSLIAYFGLLDPENNMDNLVYLAIIISFVSATYDIAYDAMRVELLKREEQGAGAAMSVFGYRVGSLVAGGISLIVAQLYDWKTSFVFIASTLMATSIATLFANEPKKVEEELNTEKLLKWLKEYMLRPFSEFAKEHKKWILIIIFAICYKIGDALLGKMANPFYQQMGFTKIEVAEITKFFGFAMTVLGGFIGGWAVYKIGIMKSLLIFGIMQSISNLSFVWQASVGHDILVLTIVIALENITGAMGTAAFVAYLSSLCNIKFTATQYALLTSFASLGRYFTNAPSGYLVDPVNGLGLSWEVYFLITVLISIPGLLMIGFLKKKSD